METESKGTENKFRVKCMAKLHNEVSLNATEIKRTQVCFTVCWIVAIITFNNSCNL